MLMGVIIARKTQHVEEFVSLIQAVTLLTGFIFYDYRDAIGRENLLRGLTIFPSFSLISEAYAFIELPKCEVDLVPAFFMFVFLILVNYCYRRVERTIHKFRFYQDPYLVAVVVPGGENNENLAGNMFTDGESNVRYMSARPHAYTNFDYEQLESENYGSINTKSNFSNSITKKSQIRGKKESRSKTTIQSGTLKKFDDI